MLYCGVHISSFAIRKLRRFPQPPTRSGRQRPAESGHPGYRAPRRHRPGSRQVAAAGGTGRPGGDPYRSSQIGGRAGRVPPGRGRREVVAPRPIPPLRQGSDGNVAAVVPLRPGQDLRTVGRGRRRPAGGADRPGDADRCAGGRAGADRRRTSRSYAVREHRRGGRRNTHRAGARGVGSRPRRSGRSRHRRPQRARRTRPQPDPGRGHPGRTRRAGHQRHADPHRQLRRVADGARRVRGLARRRGPGVDPPQRPHLVTDQRPGHRVVPTVEISRIGPARRRAVRGDHRCPQHLRGRCVDRTRGRRGETHQLAQRRRRAGNDQAARDNHHTHRVRLPHQRLRSRAIRHPRIHHRRVESHCRWHRGLPRYQPTRHRLHRQPTHLRIPARRLQPPPLRRHPARKGAAPRSQW